MYLSSSDGVDGVDVDDNSQTRHGNTPPVNSNPSQSSSPSCPTLLVIDDNSNSNDSSLNTTDIPSNSVSATAQTAHIQVPPSSPLPTLDLANDTPEKQRRRNSSIAKLLGGQPLNNQQYEEINQQILDDQSAQNGTNSDNKTDSSIPRARSSLTRTMFMNAERNNNNNNTPPTMNKAGPPSPGFSKDFEYLIRRELDIDHAPSTLNRNTSTPSVFQNLSSVRNTPPINNAQSPSQSKLKRKRPNPKQTIPTPTPTPTTNKPSNIAPFTIRDPFELDSSVPPINPVNIHSSQRQQNDLFRFDGSSHRQHHHHHHQHHQHPHHPNQQQQQQQPQQQYSLPMNNSTGNSTSFNAHKLNLTSPSYAQFKIHHDRLPSASSCSSSSSSPYNYCHYPPTTELALPTPVSIHASSPSMIPYHTGGASSRKNKTMHSRPDIYEIPMQRSCSTMSNQSNASTTPSSSSGHHSVPLKKRLLHAYKNEQRPSSSL